MKQGNQLRTLYYLTMAVIMLVLSLAYPLPSQSVETAQINSPPSNELVNSPEITSIEPEKPYVEGLMTIKGKNFGNAIGIVILRPKDLTGPSDKDQSLQITKWSEIEIQAIVPFIKQSDWNLIVQALPGNSSSHFSGQKLVYIETTRTDRPFVADFFVGSEYTSETNNDNKNFSKAFPHIGFRINTKIHETDNCDWCIVNQIILRSFFNLKLVSISIEQQPSPQTNAQSPQPQLSAERSLDINGGVAMLFRLGKYAPTRILEFGPVFKYGGQTSATEQEFFIKSFEGFRLLQAGTEHNSAYMDIGRGLSQNFIGKERWRLKIEGFIPILTKKGPEFFIDGSIDAARRTKPDVVTLSAGIFFEPEKFLGYLYKPYNK